VLHRVESLGEDVRRIFCRWNVVESNSLLLNFVSGMVVFDVDMFGLCLYAPFPVALVRLGCRSLFRLHPRLTIAFLEQVS
jgi:hypothetical protein